MRSNKHRPNTQRCWAMIFLNIFGGHLVDSSSLKSLQNELQHLLQDRLWKHMFLWHIGPLPHFSHKVKTYCISVFIPLVVGSMMLTSQIYNFNPVFYMWGDKKDLVHQPKVEICHTMLQHMLDTVTCVRTLMCGTHRSWTHQDVYWGRKWSCATLTVNSATETLFKCLSTYSSYSSFR